MLHLISRKKNDFAFQGFHVDSCHGVMTLAVVNEKSNDRENRKISVRCKRNAKAVRKYSRNR